AQGRADGVRLPHEPPAGRALRGDRAVRARRPRPRAARVAAAACDAVEVPVRRGRRRASARAVRANRTEGTGGGHALAACRRRLRRSSRGGIVSSTETAQDPYVLQVRRQISDVDSALVDLVNKRLKLVAQLKRYKDEHGIGFVDLAREEWMLQYLQRAN